MDTSIKKGFLGPIAFTAAIALALSPLAANAARYRQSAVECLLGSGFAKTGVMAGTMFDANLVLENAREVTVELGGKCSVNTLGRYVMNLAPAKTRPDAKIKPAQVSIYGKDGEKYFVIDLPAKGSARSFMVASGISSRFN